MTKVAATSLCSLQLRGVVSACANVKSSRDSLYPRVGLYADEGRTSDDMFIRRRSPKNSEYLSSFSSCGLGSPMKVDVSRLTGFQQSHATFFLDETMPVQLPYSAHNRNTARSNWVAAEVPPPPGLDRLPSSLSLECNDSANQPSSKSESSVGVGQRKCSHGLHVCNRMLNGKTCKNEDCWAKSKLCHDQDCCANKARPRLGPCERQAAKALARQAKAELDNLDLRVIASRVNDPERGLGYKWRALDKLKACDPTNVDDAVLCHVITELHKALDDSATVFRVREEVRAMLEIWEPRVGVPLACF